MTWINSAFTINDAIARDQNTWDLLISDWGRIAATDGYSHSFPKVGERGMPTVFGVAIGNQSEVDRCFVANDIEKIVPGQVTWDVAHRLSIGSPLIFPQIGSSDSIVKNGSPLNPSTGEATLVIYPTGTSSIVSNGGVSPTLFGATYRKADGSTVAFPAITPLLHLVFYLKPPVAGAPTSRAPWTLNLTDTALAPQTEKAFVFPTFGRKKFFVDMVTNGIGAAVDYRVAVIRNCTFMATVGEVTVGTAAGVAINVPHAFTVDPAYADFGIVYATYDTGQTFSCSIVAVD